ncbi:hypothetical protein [Demequina soli]|uniref:hypothetical protein n=1 Tax=Demequina soli TaxID=1638987 RepID=UPI00078330B3|nr:hypothetical protein [Demequina soli]
MTAIAYPPVSRRVLNGARVHAANPWTTLGLPWVILVAVFGLTYSIWRIVAWAAGGVGELDADAFRYAGGVTWILGYMVTVSAQAMNQTFRFAMGLSQTRRDYFAGTCLYFLGASAGYALGIAVLAAAERATDGWGVHGAFFAPAFLFDVPLWQVAWFFFGLMMLTLAIGIAAGAVFVRWRATGLVTMLLTIGVLAVGGAFLLTWADAWGPVGSFFVDTSVAVLVAWTLPVTALAVGAGYALLSRATVRD